jgi:hypothetical protein
MQTPVPESRSERRFVDHRPEKGLMLAVLEEAVATFQHQLGAESRRGRRLFREADEWFRSADTSWAFAFESVCDVLGLDPDYVRRGLARLRRTRSDGGARPHRFRRMTGRRMSLAPPRVGPKGAKTHRTRWAS